MVLQVQIGTPEEAREYHWPMYLSSMTRNRFAHTVTYRDTSVRIRLVRYLAAARKQGDDYVAAALKPGGPHPQLITLKLTHKEKSQTVHLTAFKAQPGTPHDVMFGDVRVRLTYGAQTLQLPFTLKLDRFVLQRYPGSHTPSSYESYVTVIDRERNTTFPYHIYMNHVLNYRGYRFFQSSYDMDEQGSILSVNHDPGTWPTYLGYLLMVIGFVWGFLAPSGRLHHLKKRLAKLKENLPGTTTAVVALASLLFAVPSHAGDLLDPIRKIDPAHAERFGHLIVQDFGGRMKPIDTLAREILSKISRKNSWEGLSANQVILGMLTRPDLFQQVRMIKIAHPLLAKKLHLPKSTRYVAYNDLFDASGHYRLADDVRTASRKAAGERSTYDKELLKTDERLNVEYMVFQGAMLRIFPRPNDPNHTWAAPMQAMKTFPKKTGEMVRLFVSNYFQNISEALKSGSWTKADTALEMIAKYQHFYGEDVMPSASRVRAEILYNQLRIFDRLIGVYLLIGLVTLVLAFVTIVRPSFRPIRTMRLMVTLLVAAFVIHTFGMALRWYVAGHAPWSDAYESLIYIAWATALAGFFFVKRSPITFAATAILTGIFMFVAFLSNLDPQITNLIPVLKSYWLTIHVAVITASYGFLGLGALLGLLVLILFIVRGKRANPPIERAIKELSYINEMGLLIGLALLTVGNFLGGVWANESWGRYWGWDPKETWAAVTILVYAAVVHMRFVPRLNTLFAFNVAALLAYGSVIMTYFGVNYYLSGLHSYAAGDPVPIPGWVTPALVLLGAVIAWASRYRNEVKK